MECLGEKAPDRTRIAGGILFFNYLRKMHPDLLLDFRSSGDKWQTIHSWLLRNVATTSFYPKIWINRECIPPHPKRFRDLNMARPKGACNKKTLLREAEQRRLTADGNGEVLVDCLHVMEKAMRHFYFKAVKEQERGDKADQIVVGAAFNQAAVLAEKVAPYRHARLAPMKLSGHPNAREIPD